jgi:lipopolysaccharide transport system ATP-binding protein
VPLFKLTHYRCFPCLYRLAENSYRFKTMSPALRVEGVSKVYRIYDQPNDRLKEMLTRGHWKRHREFWALKNIDFEIEAGTTTGIIGPNGSGKSTLLQIMTGTLEPTQGNVWHEGRIAALLELGSGFNSEFTGIENVFMNAALMGFSRSETEALLPAIERFAEIGPFIHQPVKTYSSGMYVRLAFAIAASVEPDILIIDEALAVGDALFQHRCLRRINELHERGATVLFVSHDAAAVRALCSRAILLKAGHVIADGKPADVLNLYQKIIMEREQAYEVESDSRREESPPADLCLAPLSYSYRHGDGSAEIVGAELTDSVHRRVEIVESGEALILRVVARVNTDLNDPVVGFLIKNRHGIHAYGTNTKELQIQLGAVTRGKILEITFAFDCWLGIDQYSISLAVHSRDGQSYDWLDGAIFFRVTSMNHMEGVANLNASVTARHRAMDPDSLARDSGQSLRVLEGVSYGR